MNKPKSRQAVLLIHGIGEQRPMATLREFVASLVGHDFRSKPDDLSRSFELRRLTHEVEEEKGKEKYQTCFFECYWAYRFRDTNYRNILEWGNRLVRTPWKNVPPRLRGIWLLPRITLIVLIIVVVLTIDLASKAEILTALIKKIFQWASGIGGVLSLLLGMLSGFILYQLGDAARYLDPLPANIVERQAVRTQGVDLLRKLHNAKDGDKPKYDRIIVIGHSLGSVIGYDILKFYWAEVNEKLPIVSGSVAKNKLDEVQQLGNELQAESKPYSEEDAKKYQKAQDDLMKVLPPNKPWRITDFVSIGSPLNYTDFLIATSKEDLQLLKEQRELPTCPPQNDKKNQSYSYPCSYDANNKVLHHAAHFALTKWTNLHFPEDLIAGKVWDLLGRGVLDLECNFTPKLNLCFRRIFWWRSHTHYWSKYKKSSPTSLNHLKKIVLWPAHKRHRANTLKIIFKSYLNRIYRLL
jgi:hypothetical protein